MVVFIIAIMVSMIGPRFFQSANDVMLRDAKTLQSKLGLASDLAVLQARNYALGIDPKRYAFFGQNEEGKWVELAKHAVLKSVNVDEKYQLELLLDGLEVDLPKIESEGFVPQVYFLSSGEMTPMTLRLSWKDKKEVLPIQMRFDPLGNAKVLQGDEELSI